MQDENNVVAHLETSRNGEPLSAPPSCPGPFVCRPVGAKLLVLSGNNISQACTAMNAVAVTYWMKQSQLSSPFVVFLISRIPDLWMPLPLHGTLVSCINPAFQLCHITSDIRPR